MGDVNVTIQQDDIDVDLVSNPVEVSSESVSVNAVVSDAEVVVEQITTEVNVSALAFSAHGHAASEITISDAGGFYSGADVETALQEIGAGTTLDDRYVEVAGDIMTGNLSLGDNNITNVGDIALDTISSDSGGPVSVLLGTDAGDDFIVGNNSALVVEGDNDRVGIGTATPAEKLEIEDSNATTTLQISNAAVDGDPQLAFALSGVKKTILKIDDGDSDKFKIEDGSGNTWITIDNSSGDVGIGTTSPATPIHIFDNNPVFRMEDDGGAYSQWRTGGAGSIQIQADEGNTAANSVITFEIDGDQLVKVDTNGFFGVGALSPAELLEIEDANATTTLQISNTAVDGDPQLAFARSGAKKFTIGVDGGDSDKLKIGTTAIGTGTKLVIEPDGDVIIGGDVAGSGMTISGNGTVETRGGRIKNTTTVTTTYTIVVTDDVIYGNTDAGAFTVTLPAGVEGQTLKIVNSGSSSNQLTITPDGSEDLLGINANHILNDGESLIISFNSSDGWY